MSFVGLDVHEDATSTEHAPYAGSPDSGLHQTHDDPLTRELHPRTHLVETHPSDDSQEWSLLAERGLRAASPQAQSLLVHPDEAAELLGGSPSLLGGGVERHAHHLVLVLLRDEARRPGRVGVDRSHGIRQRRAGDPLQVPPSATKTLQQVRSPRPSIVTTRYRVVGSSRIPK